MTLKLFNPAITDEYTKIAFGLGKYLFGVGIKHLWNLKVKAVTLIVTVENQGALKLYLNSGFEITEEFESLRKII